MKQKLVATLFGCSIILMLLQNCMRDKKTGEFHISNELASFKKLNRKEQVEKCGSCHKQEYENELKGPHANAYHRFKSFKDFINSAHFNCDPYTEWVNKGEEHCISCHAGENLYENLYVEYMANPDKVDSLIQSPDFIWPNVRSGKNALFTGIDCLTCHFDGNRVVTNASFVAEKKSNSPEYCNPVGSAFFSSNNNCLACHTGHVKEMVTPDTDFPVKETSCVKCHQEYSTTGKGTHYYYWANNPPDKQPKFPLLGILNDIIATVHGNSIDIVWKNKTMPHRVTDQRELVIDFIVQDKNHEPIAQHRLRINHKGIHDEHMKGELGGTVLPGVEGVDLPTKGEGLQVSIPIKKTGSKPYELNIRAYNKGQYWVDDKTAIFAGNPIVPLM